MYSVGDPSPTNSPLSSTHTDSHLVGSYRLGGAFVAKQVGQLQLNSAENYAQNTDLHGISLSDHCITMSFGLLR